MKTLRPNNGRARLAILFMYIYMAVAVISVFASYMAYNLYGRIEEGNYTMDEANTSDIIVAVAALLGLGVYIAVVVTFIMWFRRAYYNVHALGVPLNFSEGWAAGSFFVPFMNLVRPYVIMTEIWRETQAYLVPEGERYRFKADNTVIGVWWGLFLLWSIISNIVARLTWNPTTIEEFRAEALGEIFTSLLALPGLFACIAVIRKVSSAEDKLYEAYKKPVVAEDLIVTN